MVFLFLLREWYALVVSKKSLVVRQAWDMWNFILFAIIELHYAPSQFRALAERSAPVRKTLVESEGIKTMEKHRQPLPQMFFKDLPAIVQGK